MNKGTMTKKYINGEITIVWKPGVCIHSGICVRGLPLVFNTDLKPWINIQAATTAQLIQQVNQCPSGALSYYNNIAEDESSVEIKAETKLEAVPDGPLLVYGNVWITDAFGHETRKNKVTAFCRCGQSGNKPFCDGSHKKARFKDGKPTV
ncbi:(4Fe-4S)-binding protein [Hydrotalea sp.]|uniref:(4Fe-4S)-binding protein n=1 Tax=Hydrotalea sp. TaxID=2881279 RepID=UPI0025870C10|nr:(4Fe-4S)-binding protein [Hydrotalea sp.]